MATVRPFQVNNGLEVNLNANVATTITAADFIQSTAVQPVAPTFAFDFAKTQRLDPRITFVRPTSATYTAANGMLMTAANNEPRFQYENGQCVGLLLELYRTNYYRGSSNIFNNVNAGGNGGYFFWDGSIGIRQYLSILSTLDYTISLYVKRNASTVQELQIDLGDGTAASAGLATAPIGVWKRISATVRYGVSGNFADVRVNAPNVNFGVGKQGYDPAVVFGPLFASNYGIAPNGKQESSRIAYYDQNGVLVDIEIWGYQVEDGTYLTSYIPTPDGATATRWYDEAYIDNSNNHLQISTSRGSYHFVGKSYKAHNANNFSYDTGTGFLTIQDFYGTQENYFNVIARDESINQLYNGHTTFIANTLYQNTSVGGGSGFLFANNEVNCIASYGNNQYTIAGTSNGASNTSGFQWFANGSGYPIPSKYVCFGRSYGLGNRIINGPIKKIAYYNRVLSNTEILAITKN